MRPKTTARAESAPLSASAARSAMLAKLKDSLLNEADAKLLGMEPYTAAECVKLGALPAHATGFRIPYFDIQGRRSKFWRYRYLESTLTGFAALTDKKPLRYAQPGKTLNELYLPPLSGVNWSTIAAAADMPLIITEGELKAACATKQGFPTIGLGGVWCFKSASAQHPLLPQFKEFNWKAREVYIAYDSDAITNHLVMSAENALARELTMHGASPYIVRIPPTEEGGKQGLDDYIKAHGSNRLAQLLEEATEWRAASELFALNEEVVYVRDPGIILRLSNFQRLMPRAFTDHAYSTRVYHEVQATDKGTKLVERSAAKEWLKWPQRAEVSAITYAPGQPRITQDGKLNFWQGWGVDPVPGDIEPWRKLLDYLFGDDKKARQWFERWCAYPLQHPGTKLYSCALLWGLRHGTGKSLVGYTLGRIYGRNFAVVKDKDMHGSFNGWAENRQFVLGEEVTGGDKRATSDAMKALITQEILTINQKYVATFEVPDCLNYYFTSNHPDSFFLEDDDRRNFIHEVRGEPMARDVYKAYDAWMRGTGPAYLFHHLLKLPLGDFDPKGPALVTEAKREMIESGRSDLGDWVAMLRDDPDTVLRMDQVILKYDLWRSEDLLAIYDPASIRRVTANGLARELKRAGFKRPTGTSGVRTSRGQVRLWAIRNEVKYLKMQAVDLGKAYDKERNTHGSRTDKKSKF